MKSKKINIILIIIFLSTVCIIGLITRRDDIKFFFKPNDIFQAEKIRVELGPKIKSGSLATDYNANKVVDDIYKFRLNTINVPVVIDIDIKVPNEMKLNEDSKNKAVRLIKKLNKLGINVILEPYPYLNGGEVSETEWDPTNINTWFWNWKTNVLSELIKDIATPFNVYALNIASNLVKIEYAGGYWCDTVDYVRKYYKGLVTYRTNWWSTAIWDEKSFQKYTNNLNNLLFSKLDFISVAAYFELTGNPINSVPTLTNAIFSTEKNSRKQNIYQELKNFHKKTDKPIFFGELGFPKKNGASTQPWNPSPTNIFNEQEQANCFQAYRNVFEKEQWIKGISVFFVGDFNENREYYPGKESTDIIRNWFTKVK